MNFEVSSSQLLSELVIGSGAIGPNPVIPILDDYLFDLNDNTLTITSTNLETTITSTLTVAGSENGRIAVPAKTLLETLKALPDQPISFVLDTDTNGITLKSKFGEYKLAGDNPEDFPELPSEENTNALTLDAKVLNNAIVKTIFATSSDELRLAMTGVYVHVDFNKVIFVATDAHKLVKYTFGNIASEETASFIIPKKALALLKNALLSEGEVKMSYNTKNAFFSFGETHIVCRLIDAKYPDYNAVIPVENPNLLTIDRRDFLNSLKRINIYANKTTNQVILNINENSITMSAQDLDFSNEATEVLSCAYSGDPMNIGFNAKFLAEMLSAIDTKEVNMKLSTPNRAGLLLPSEQEDNEELLMLVMPVMMGS